MSEWMPVISAIITVLAAVYLALHKSRSEEFRDLEKKTNEHGTKIAQLEVRMDNVENVRLELNEIRKRLDHIQENMITKDDIRLNS